MSHRHIKLFANLAGAGFCGAVVHIAYWSLTAPCLVPGGVPSGEIATEGRALRQASEEPLPPPTLKDFEPLWGRKYRPPLVDPPPPPPPHTAPAPPPQVAFVPPPTFDLQLLGTIVDPGGSRAVFSDPSGKTVLGGVGDHLGDGWAQLEILEIDTRSVVVQHSGRQITLDLEPKERAYDQQDLDALGSR